MNSNFVLIHYPIFNGYFIIVRALVCAEKDPGIRLNILRDTVILNNIAYSLDMKGDGVNSPAGAYSRPHPSVQPDAIRMVEDFIREWSGHYNCRALWEHLPNQMMYQTYKEIIEYLLSSNRIVIDSEGYVGWIFDYNLYKRYAQRPELRVR